MKHSHLKNKIRCNFDGGFVMPKMCFSCGESSDEKKWQITATNFLKNRKYIFKFPVCNACVEAHSNYINILPVNLVGAVVLLFTLFTMILADTNIPHALFYIGGLLWIAIVIWYLVSMNIKARKLDAEVDSQRAKDLKTAIYFEKVTLNKKEKKGEAIILFRNKKFSNEFVNLNKGKFID